MKAIRSQDAVFVTTGSDDINSVPSLRVTPDGAVLWPRPDVMVVLQFRDGMATTVTETTSRVANPGRPGDRPVHVTTWLTTASLVTRGVLAELAHDRDLGGDTVLQLFVGTRGVPRVFRELARFAFALV